MRLAGWIAVTTHAEAGHGPSSTRAHIDLQGPINWRAVVLAVRYVD